MYKSYGLNHVRFHSWCPPEAAFEAADKLGIYIQAETIWIDWWMTDPPKDRPDMETKGHPNGLGKNPSADKFVQDEMQRMIDAYGNHPSFVMLCIGNELGNSDFNQMEQWVKKLKEKDNRRLYATSTARKIMPVDDYSVTHNIPNVGGTYGLKGGRSDYDLEKTILKAIFQSLHTKLVSFRFIHCGQK
ncbi:glycoside hydrolase family 2 TIM barrel-domain containing protein [Pedobacter steynii]